MLVSSGKLMIPAMHARRHQVLDRIYRHHGERVDLLGRLHRAQLGRHRRPGPRRDHQRRQHRPQLAHQHQRDHGAERALRAEAAQRVVALQAQHHPGERADKRHQHDRFGPDGPHLADRQPRLVRRRRRAPERVHQEQHEVAERGDIIDHQRAKALDHLHNSRHPDRPSSRGRSRVGQAGCKYGSCWACEQTH